MKSDINDLCEAFLAALTNAGYAVKSIEKDVYKRQVRQASLFPAPVFLPEVPVLFPYIYSYQLHRPCLLYTSRCV